MILLVVLAIATITPVWAVSNAQVDWKISIVPAELNADRTVKLLSDCAQQIYIMPQIRQELYDANTSHDITIEINVPSGIDLLDQAGFFLERIPMKSKLMGDTRKIITLTVTVRNPWLCTMKKLNSEWKGQSLLVKAAADIPHQQSWITVAVIDADGNRYSNRYNLMVTSLVKSGVQPKTLRVGLWTYGLYAIRNGGCEPLAMFLQRVGVNYVEKAKAESLSAALKAHGIIDGGAVHHSAFCGSGVS